MKVAQSLNIQADYKTEYLVDCLKKHKEQHVNEYRTAYANYLLVRVEKAKVIVEGADKIVHNPQTEKSGLMEAYNSLVSLTKPVDASKMYDEYISLLSASTSDTVRMDVNDANAIINDRWQWAIDAKFSNSMYAMR